MSDALSRLRDRYPMTQTYTFGDSAGLNAELIALVRAGKQRATCSSVLDEHAGESKPEIGRYDISLTYEGEPALVTRTMELRVVRYCDMTAEMALMEGEDDSLEGWQAGHKRYYERHGVFSPEMELIWERFELIEDLGT